MAVIVSAGLLLLAMVFLFLKRADFLALFGFTNTGIAGVLTLVTLVCAAFMVGLIFLGAVNA